MKTLILFALIIYETIWSIDTQPTKEPDSAIQKKILSDLSWPVKVLYYKESYPENPAPVTEPSRRVGIEEWRLSFRGRGKKIKKGRVTLMPEESEESDMKQNLFRLMSEMVMDNDLKVKRANLIRGHYANDSAFEIGYLMGDITDKYNVMTDTSLAMNRFYNEWKPIEHMNAYEQITNQAVEISHIAALMSQAAHKNFTSTSSESSRFIFRRNK